MTRQYVRCVFCDTEVDCTEERVEDVIPEGPRLQTRGLRMVECPVCRTSVEVPENQWSPGSSSRKARVAG